ncbi:unnamed protein product [Brugia timori]|uniref:Ig-like domain-containing protein n=1 Tax=Brugia timori TaxID=42155 RepID=A0A0R3R8J4_9BILA|nr:unnamed protein product [Brugia timori]
MMFNVILIVNLVIQFPGEMLVLTSKNGTSTSKLTGSSLTIIISCGLTNSNPFNILWFD